MRMSNREKILDAVVRVIEKGGITAVTFDAVAAESGITRGGVIYHFPSRENMMLETHRHLARLFEADLEALAGPSPTEAQRYSAYVQSSMGAVARAELVLMLEASTDPLLREIWAGVMDRWAPPVPQPGDDAGMMRFLARKAADGIWAHEINTGERLPEEVRARAGQALLKLLNPG